MFGSVSLLVLLPIFVGGAVAVWLAGVQLSNTTDVIDSRFGLGQALGGLIFLAIATNLPEIAIVVSASLTLYWLLGSSVQKKRDLASTITHIPWHETQ
jgi:cation:H+ antiporter